MNKPQRKKTGFGDTPRRKDSTRQKKEPINRALKEEKAETLIRLGRLEEAENIYRELISRKMTSHTIYGNLGAIMQMQGRIEESKRWLNEALRTRKDYPEAHNNLGNVYQNQGELSEAINHFKFAIRLKPDYADAHHNLGRALEELGHRSEAISAYKNAIKENAGNAEAHYNLGTALHKQGDLGAAAECYTSAIRLRHNFPDAHNNLGILMRALGDLNAAIKSLNTAIGLQYDHPNAHNNLGVALKDQGELTAAIKAFNTAIKLRPNYADAYSNLGNSLKEKGDLNSAINSFNVAIRIDPNHPEAHNNLGTALREQGNLIGATEAFGRALDLNPDYLDALNNIGITMHERGDLNSAISTYNKALEISSDHPDTHWNLSQAELLRGNYKTGWQEYEWRAKRKHASAKPHAVPSCQLWKGEALRKGSKLTLVSEQGLGDTLQFMRYATCLRGLGFEVSLCAQPKLHELIRVSGIDQSPMAPEQTSQLNEGSWIPLLSVPRYLEVSPAKPVSTQPYIKTTKELIDKWNSIIKPAERPIIGINWQGNPRPETKGLRGRSLALETFQPLSEIDQISLLSLQKGFGSGQLEECSFRKRFVSCQNKINETWNFLETAAIIWNCDLIITSDTSVAHLAGGMGKTTWLLLHKVPDWRWGIEGNTTFWYPSIRLFRQREHGDWTGVIQSVTEALKERLD